jgi:hypothetical protein
MTNTALSFISARQITNNSGTPQSGAKLYFYRELTTTALTVWTDDAASVAHAQPVVADSGGFVPLIYVDDTYDYKVVIKTSADVTLQTYDNIPAPEPSVTATGFAPELLTWVQKTSASSPVTLTTADLGNAYEADTTGGSITFNLPSAASAGNGKGFFFKKTAAANSLIIDPSGSETIDDVSTSLTVTSINTIVKVSSNGAEWYKTAGIVTLDMIPASIINTQTEATSPADTDEFLMQLAGAGAYRKLLTKHIPGALLAIIEDQKAQNTAGGTFTSGADQTRVLNTLVYNRGTLVTLASNQFVLPIGVWDIKWSAPGFQTNAHQSWLYDITGSAVAGRGTSAEAGGASNSQSDSVGSARVSLAAATTYEIRHRCTTTRATDGFGVQSNFGVEVYTRVEVRAA